MDVNHVVGAHESDSVDDFEDLFLRIKSMGGEMDLFAGKNGALMSESKLCGDREIAGAFVRGKSPVEEGLHVSRGQLIGEGGSVKRQAKLAVVGGGGGRVENLEVERREVIKRIIVGNASVGLEDSLWASSF